MIKTWLKHNHNMTDTWPKLGLMFIMRATTFLSLNKSPMSDIYWFNIINQSFFILPLAPPSLTLAYGTKQILSKVSKPLWRFWFVKLILYSHQIRVWILISAMELVQYMKWTWWKKCWGRERGMYGGYVGGRGGVLPAVLHLRSHLWCFGLILQPSKKIL